MDSKLCTLSNVQQNDGQNGPQRVSLTPYAFPEALNNTCLSQGSDTGVSSFYTPKDNHNWFVLRARYNQLEKNLEVLKSVFEYVYIPYKLVANKTKKKIHYTTEPLVANLIFVYSTKEAITKAFYQNTNLNHLRIYRDRTKGIDPTDGKHFPLIIKFYDMLEFIKLTSILNEHIKIVDKDCCNFNRGEKVLITEGAFKGINGYVARVAGQQRVLVILDGLLTVATAYIPSAFLARI